MSSFYLKIGISMTLLSAFAYAVLTAIVKSQSAMVPLPIIVFVQSLVTLLLILPIIFKNGMRTAIQTLRSPHIFTHLIRTLFSLGISYFLFLAVAYIPLVNAVLLANTAPLLVPFIAYFFLRQKINHNLWIPILIGFAGITIVLHPNLHNFNFASLAALAAGFCMATSMLLVRKTASKDSSITISFYYFLFSTIVSGIIVIWFWIPLPLHTFLILIAEGVIFFIVQFSLAIALKNAPAELVSSLYYSNIIFAAIIEMIIWKSGLSFLTISGIILTAVGGILCIRAQSRYARINYEKTK